MLDEWAVVQLPGAALSLYTARLSQIRGAKTRGPQVELLHQVVKELPALDAARLCVEEADRIYWEMVCRHDGLIMKDAQLLSGRAKRIEDLDELVQVLRFGWYRAAIRFDPTVDVSYPFYAMRWGRSWLQRSNERQSDVALPFHAQGPSGGWGSLATTSLDDPISSNDGPRTRKVDLIVDEGSEDIEDTLVGNADAFLIRDAYQWLPERSQLVLGLRYGLGPHHAHTLTEVAQVLKISRERVRQLLRDALDRMRIEMGEVVDVE